MKHVFLVDGSGFIFRAFHGLPPMSRSDGTPTNALFGFCTMLMKLLDDTEADHIAVVFDTARKTFRNDLYPEYKAHRPPAPDELIPQFPLIRDAVKAFNVASVEMEGFEADDLIATYAKQAAEQGAEVTIVSSDKDLMQLVDERITMFDAMKNKIIGAEQVIEKFGMGPDKVIEIQALAGDSSDNVPGVPGIGVKTAAQLLTEYGDLESLLARAGEIKQPKRREKLIEFAGDARISRELVTLRQDVPITVPLEEFATRKPDPETLLGFLKEHELKRLLSKVASRYGSDVAIENAPPEMAVPEKAEYELVQDMASLKKWIDEVYEAGSVAVDTETTSVDAMRASLVGVSLSIEPGKACYIPLRHKGPEVQGSLFDEGPAEDSAPEQISFDEAMAVLKPMFEDPAIMKIGQNLKYDALVLSQSFNGGTKLAPIDDTMLLSYVLEGGAHGHGMDELALHHFDYSTIKFKDVAGAGKKQVTFDYVELDKALDYAAEDADITQRLYRVLKPRLVTDKMATVYETIERPLVPVLVEMERNGIKVNAQELKRLSDDFGQRLNELEGQIHELAGREFNVGSPKQLGEVLFDELELPGGKKGKTGAYTTGVEILEKLATESDHEMPGKVLQWRQLAKLKSTYADALIGQINPDTGRVHTSFSMAGTTTGRLASSDPNIQNIPIRTLEGQKIRKAFVAEPGHKLISADYSQIELRLLAHVAEIDTLKEAFHNGQDIHALTASQVFGVPIEGMDPMVRRSAKAINFGIVYGISAFGLAKQLDISNGEAKNYIDSYFESYPGIRAYMDKTKEEARSLGYVTTFMGRKCHIKGINEKNPNMRNFGERAAINAPIQGGAADIIKKAMIRLPNALEEAGLKAKMLLQVHDELVFEAVESEVEATIAVAKKVMEGAAQLSVPLDVDVGFGDDWTEAH
ncbi:MAG: DNA polymerase I [Rhodospirillales bacterium]|nr:DNA polymerase I [Rhodospirillales bacterium]